MDRLKAHTGLGPVSPAEAASHAHPPKMPAAPSACTFVKMPTGGGLLGLGSVVKLCSEPQFRNAPHKIVQRAVVRTVSLQLLILLSYIYPYQQIL